MKIIEIYRLRFFYFLVYFLETIYIFLSKKKLFISEIINKKTLHLKK